MRFTAVLLFLAAPLHAAEPAVLKDVPYAEPKNERQTLDVYSPAGAKNRPIVFWVHGGGWKAGDKKDFQKKALAFVDKGYVFVATNYRFRPAATVKEMTGDVARAIRWVHEHAREFGGDPNAIVVMGHSAGAQLAALVCTDDRYLKAEKVPLSALKGCVPVDCSFYDIPKRVKDGGTTPLKTITDIFTDSEETQRDYSAAAHVAKGKDIPPFLVLHVATRDDTKAQAHWLADKLKDAGVAAKVVAAEDKTHGSIGSDLGQKDDAPTKALFEFLDGVLKK
ncbi:para-nitrobenzyl esterase : Esterase/lipase OS=Singulisphaera acidiphila (strain ATCC BAA-1392 / DSM 18658 / VKM B-2454 / MOB10) GN=Sinac_5481 PE=4 SV=1: Abhydrolase_3 [Gemmataceae bacterium]|nr:para-nitrobenzyl esterase : Esterase/lipase OS=Singulisphaera acidiphila (strain ATCC BAA-1392 / DSM 18658 / VKM B-2454 / MOB10) GN=Sinac_5481 PE=4 SV=1: Abhydrolase_3 [Gemmataceae bacterium]VTT97714.1 para-nitrobenzyl esterase : Esterase/lipase OS=Singulisphaera acidiphila (strain ATCC BAA-1392 / DSM 18658 / VKM B-2454 / MOB10) GN=Sinac_5481 PE=4 SV=1: Abhydrolase_3 [Gemmataceae bacterium]